MTEKKNNNKIDSSNEFKKLSIQISLNGLSFCIVDTLDNSILQSKAIHFKEELNPFQLQKELKQFLESNKITDATFSEVIVIHRNSLFGLVPKTLFNEDNLKDYLKYNAQILANDHIAYDEIENYEIINVYVPLVNINNYIYDLFGEFTFKHSASVIIPSLLNNNKNKDAVCYVYAAENQMDITVANNKRLQLFNSFQYSTTEDFMYYLLFTMEQLKLDSETTKLRLFGDIEEESELCKSCSEYIKNVSIYIPDESNYRFGDNTENTIDFTVLNSL